MNEETKAFIFVTTAFLASILAMFGGFGR